MEDSGHDPQATCDSNAEALEHMVNLLLHELRTPLSIAHGYLRLLAEDRLADVDDRRQAVQRALEALGEVATLCAGASDYLDSAPAALETIPVSAFMAAVARRCHEHRVQVAQPSVPVQGSLRSVRLSDAAIHVSAILLATLRNCPTLPKRVHISVQDRHLVLTTGDEMHHQRLVEAANHVPLNPWIGGSGLRVPLALRQLASTQIRLWTLPDEAAGVALAIPLS